MEHDLKTAARNAEWTKTRWRTTCETGRPDAGRPGPNGRRRTGRTGKKTDAFGVEVNDIIVRSDIVP